jgi:hypothetical protein
MDVLADRMARAGSPGKQAAVLAAVDLTGPGPFMLLGHASRARASALVFATYSAGKHPFVGVTEEGVNILCHTIQCNRRGQAKLRTHNFAYVSKHALGRLHERGDASPEAVTAVLGHIGLLGYLTRHNQQHFESGLCLHLGDVLVVGSLKYGMAGDQVTGLYDVRTILNVDEVKDQAMVQQGMVAAQVVREWTQTRNHALADQIPYLPRRENDYTLRAAARQLGGLQDG